MDNEAKKTENCDKKREEMKARCYRLKEAGICTKCGKRPATRGIRCEECYQAQKAAQSRYDEKVKQIRKQKKDTKRSDWTSYGWRHGRSELSKEMLRLMAKYPDMPPAAYGRMKVREYWEAQGVKTT